MSSLSSEQRKINRALELERGLLRRAGRSDLIPVIEENVSRITNYRQAFRIMLNFLSKENLRRG